MLWRFLQWVRTHAIGELMIVTVGVLIALAVNQWNTDRLDRAEEVLIVQRILSDLESDVGNFKEALKILDEKENSLKRIYSVLVVPNTRPQNLPAFLGDVIAGANYGWNQPIARRITFDELLSSGRFRLIRSPELREMIAAYYSLDQDTHSRIEERETGFPAMSYQLVPRGSEFELDPTLTMREMEQLTTRVLDASVLDHVTAELNFSRFVRAIFTDLLAERDKLYAALASYRESIE